MLGGWYYQNQTGVVGPVSVAELKFLLDGGNVKASTLVRRGDEGPWLAANTIDGLVNHDNQAKVDGGPDQNAAEWHVRGKDHERLGPISWVVLLAMASETKLSPEDLVWKPGMASWVAASQVAGLFGTSSPLTARKTPSQGVFSSPGRRRILWAGVAIITLLGSIAAVAGWKWARTESRNPTASELARARVAPALSNGKAGPTKAGAGETERLLDEAITDVCDGRIDRATRLLDQYLASPSSSHSEAARLLRREIELATSTARAAALAKSFSDEQLKSLLRQGIDSLIAAIETPELRPIYEKTLLQALRQENSRRQFIPRGAIALNPDGDLADRLPEKEQPEPKLADNPEQEKPADGTTVSMLGRPEPPKLGVAPDPAPGELEERPRRLAGPISAELDDVLSHPDALVGKTVAVKGLFKIGTLLSEVKGPGGQVLGWLLPISRNNDSTVSTGDGKVKGFDAHLLLEDGLVRFLDRVFKKLGMKPTIRPTYKCILTVTGRRMLVNGSPNPVVVISSLEILGRCDYLKVARHQYADAFTTLTVTPAAAHVDFGDGDDWVERLGGEEKFVQLIRSKLREMHRRAVTNRDRDLVDRVLGPELAKAINTAIAINQIRV